MSEHPTFGDEKKEMILGRTRGLQFHGAKEMTT